MSRAAPIRTPDGRYIVVRGRLWRATDPGLDAETEARLKHALGKARSDVARAKRDRDEVLMRDARSRVQSAKVALGERGPVWWDDGARDWNRYLIKNTPYAGWWAQRGDGAGS